MTTHRFPDVRPAVKVDAGDTQNAQSVPYISLRWKLLLPLFSVLLAAAMVIAYLVTGSLVRAGQVSEISQLGLAYQGAQEGMRRVAEELEHEAIRLAHLEGLGQALREGDTTLASRRLSVEALAGDLDVVLVLDGAGHELLGLWRPDAERASAYNLSVDANLSADPLIGGFVRQPGSGNAGLLRLPDGYALATSAALPESASTSGAVVVARRLTQVLDDLRTNSLGHVALFGPDGTLLQSTFELRSGVHAQIGLAPEQAAAVLSPSEAVTVQDLILNGYPFQVAYQPFVLGRGVLGVLGVYLPASLPFAADLARQALSLSMAALTAVVLAGGVVMVGRMLGRVERVTQTVQHLSRGDAAARTGLLPRDEIGVLGHAVDAYAGFVQSQQDTLRTTLRRQRRENARFAAIFEALPDGVVVQDLDGRVVLMNEKARAMFGTQEAFKAGGFGELTAKVTDILGPALAPGLYALGTPQRVPFQDRVISAQAAAVVTVTGRRVGTAVALRDITEEVERERVQDELLRALAEEVQEPLAALTATVRQPAADPALQRFAAEVTRGSVRLQQLIARLRDLADLGPDRLEIGPRPLALVDLLDALEAEWQPAFQASGLTLAVKAQVDSIYVLGDERRLRWALGNLLDNALKYTPEGGRVTLLARAHGEQAAIVIQDTGVGIAPEDLPHIFTRFYRGVPRTVEGAILRVPGMGQGLFIARRVMEAHGGRLDVQSVQYRGTRALCLLPLTSPEPMEMRVPRGEEDQTVPVRQPRPYSERDYHASDS
ncbi:MAG: hypothetical protein Kow0077_05920 [Anaerolineae bacterium]